MRGSAAAFPPSLYRTPVQRIALQDALTRRFARQAEAVSFRAKGSGHSGQISVSRCGQEVLERTACCLDPTHGDLCLRLEVGFPAQGRTIQARELEKILFDFLPQCIHATLFYRNLDSKQLQAVADLAEDQQYIRDALPQMGLCAFVANGSILPRASGRLCPFHEERRGLPVSAGTGGHPGPAPPGTDHPAWAFQRASP